MPWSTEEPHPFLFASWDSKSTKPNSARKLHVRRLYDLLQLSLQRRDVQRAGRAWSILARCRELDWKTMWLTGVRVLGIDLHDIESAGSRIAFLRVMMLQNPDERERILTELILRLITSERYEEALNELELYLPSLPYQDNPVLHTYGGLLRLYLSQPANAPDHGVPHQLDATAFDQFGLREAKACFERALQLDSKNAVAEAFVQKIATLKLQPRTFQEPGDHPSDEEDVPHFSIQTEGTRRKRVRT